MPRIPGTNNQQSAFLRALIKSPDAPPPEVWPKPVIFRRWLRKPGFRAAMDSLRDSLRYEADLHLAYAARNAARALSSPPQPPPGEPQVAQASRLCSSPSVPPVSSPAVP